MLVLNKTDNKTAPSYPCFKRLNNCELVTALHAAQTASCLNSPSAVQLENLQRRACHLGAPLVMSHFTGLLTGGNTVCHCPFSKLTLSMLRKKTGSILKRNDALTCFFPASAAIAKISIGVSGVLNRPRFMIVWGSSFKWVCSGFEKESIMAISSLEENSVPVSSRYALNRSRPS